MTDTNPDVAIVTGLYLATYNAGGALGNTVSGVIWQRILPGELLACTGNATLAAAVFKDPFTFATAYPVPTKERFAVMLAYRHIQHFLCITGACCSILLIGFSLCLRNPELGKEQSLEGAEERGVDNGRVDGTVQKKSILRRLFN